MDKPDRIRVQHMLEAAREAIQFVNGRQESDLATDRMLLLSLVKEIEILGEAANQISRIEPGRATEIPWARIVNSGV